jgi:hypothetical protein
LLLALHLTGCKEVPELQEPVRGPAWLKWHEVKEVDHYYLSVDAVIGPMEIREKREGFEEQKE